jgi:sensor c-di-GMP phosphodiesterase-like protein
MYKLARFRYMTAAFAVLALLFALAFAMLIAWRNVGEDLDARTQRAVFNAERLLDRTVNDLSKVDSLRGYPCDASAIRVLQEVVYNSLTQIREVGLIRDGRLYCTNFGPTTKEIPIPAALTEVGVHTDVAPNSVMINNTSLYVYVSREKGSAVNALFNPQVLAEFERDFPYVGYGNLALDINHSIREKSLSANGMSTVYTVGEPRAQDANAFMFSRTHPSKRSGFAATASVSPRAWWRETLELMPFFLAGFGAIAVVCGYAMRRWLLRGNLDRLRYLAAMQRNEFTMHYQPIIDAKTMKIVGAEALLRWQHPRRGLLRAAQFADIFSHDSIAAPLAERVIALVGKDLQQMPADLPVWCTINIAPTLLEDNRVLDALSAQLLAIPGHRVQIEITERAPLGEYAEVLLHELRANGVKIGMDDLGTGYANLGQLQRMPFDFIKIDGMLVRGIQSREGVTPVVKSLIDLAIGLGAEVIVEGVETKIQAEALTAAGATYLQGFYFDSARPMNEFVEVLQRQNETA